MRKTLSLTDRIHELSRQHGDLWRASVALGFGRNTLYKFLRGDRRPHVDMLRRMGLDPTSATYSRLTDKPESGTK